MSVVPASTRRPTDSFKIVGTARGASVPDLGGNDSPERAATWYPDVFNNFSSMLGCDDIPHIKCL